MYLATNDLIYLNFCSLKFTYASSKISTPVTHLVSITKNSQFTPWAEITYVQSTNHVESVVAYVGKKDFKP